MTPNLRGILLMVGAMAGFAVEDALIKLATGHVPPGQVMLGIAGIGLVAFFLWGQARGDVMRHPAALSRPVLGRTLAEAVGTLGILTALARTDLSTITAIIQATPILTVAGAALLLREQVGWRRWTAIGVGFAGVLLILRPGGAGFDPNALWAVLGVLGLAARDLCSRRIDPGLPTSVIAIWGYVAAILLSLGLIAGSGVVVPPPVALAQIAGAATIGFLSYWAIIEATRAGDVSIIAPFRYTRLVFGVALGVLIFGERLDALALAGAALILGSGLYTLWREQVRRRAGG